jgi:hypothetical protein
MHHNQSNSTPIASHRTTSRSLKGQIDIILKACAEKTIQDRPNESRKENKNKNARREKNFCLAPRGENPALAPAQPDA